MFFWLTVAALAALISIPVEVIEDRRRWANAALHRWICPTPAVVTGWILACAGVVALVFGVIALNAGQQVRTLDLTAQRALVVADVQIVLLTITLSAVAVPAAGFVQRYRRRAATWAKPSTQP